MNTQEAADFINYRVTWEPNLTVSAQPDTFCPPATMALCLNLTLRSPDSSDISPAGDYPGTPARVESWLSLRPDQFKTGELLLAAVIRHVTTMRQHETREFTRVKQDDGSWFAPFHPHRPDGETLWASGGWTKEGTA